MVESARVPVSVIVAPDRCAAANPGQPGLDVHEVAPAIVAINPRDKARPRIPAHQQVEVAVVVEIAPGDRTVAQARDGNRQGGEELRARWTPGPAR